MLFVIGLAGIGLSAFAMAGGTSVVGRSPTPGHHPLSPQFANYANVNGATTTTAGQQRSNSVCLGFADLFIAFVLILLILTTVFGNVLVVLSVFLYKRMRTFTNFLLTSLATADLLVGLLIMPLALFDLLHNHNWPLGRALCRIWATFDVLLCTASILNLCIISLDRYMAITSPLRYPRTRSRWMACALLSFVPPSSSAPLAASALNFSSSAQRRAPFNSKMLSSPSFSTINLVRHSHKTSARTAPLAEDGTYQCAYPTSVSYRIYSASVSFYIPLVVMLFVYFKIFRVASERERLIREGMGTCRLSRRIEKTQLKGRKRSATTNYTRRSNAPRIHEVIHGIASPTTKSQLDNAFGGEEKSKNVINANHCSANYSKHPSRPNPTPGGREEKRPSFGQISPTQRSSILREGDCDSEVTICPPSARNSGRSAAVAIASGNGAKNPAENAVYSVSSHHRCTTDSFRRKIKSMECLGTLDNFSTMTPNKYRKNSADPPVDCNGSDEDENEENDEKQCHQKRRQRTVEEGQEEEENAKYGQRSLQNLHNLHPMANRIANGAKQQQMGKMPNQNNNGTFGGGGGVTTHWNNTNSTMGANNQPRNSMAITQQSHFTSKNANFRGSKEKIVYLRERKALKTIGIVVLGFIICWLPFFVVYVLEVSSVLKKWDIVEKKEFQLLSEFFLWLGYSNSVINPLIYTMYNSDFRRCFRDLLGMGCMNQHRRTMSVKKLHQQSNLF
ncbi:hypothetical protein niasHT_032234 [Heterodera trifolii]|uniref:G-protein coupled receptors family 1 profile domain-containing protein n=1 Tax=Heterodera trifolii TaxID=157864 RepID=A0ABD2HR06_9BILA